MAIWRTLTDRSLLIIWLLIAVALPFLEAPLTYASNDRLDNRYDRLSTPIAGAAAQHAFGFAVSNTGVSLGSISFEFCANSPIIGEACTPIAGLDLSSITLASQSGQTGFSISGVSTASKIVLSRAAALPSAVQSEYVFANVINPSNPGSYYVRIETFTSTDGTGLNIEEGGVVFAIVAGVGVSTEVPPYLRLCVSVTISGFDCSTATSYYIDLGEFSTSTTRAASSEIVAATNASFGYSISMSGTTLTSGNNTVPSLAVPTPANPGTGQFGVNLRANSSPAIGSNPSGPGIGVPAADYNSPDLYKFVNGDVIATSTNSTDNTKYTVSYVVNVGSSQPAGIYATTVTFICLANF